MTRIEKLVLRKNEYRKLSEEHSLKSEKHQKKADEYWNKANELELEIQEAWENKNFSEVGD